MRDRTRLIRTPNSRIAPFCEICHKVDGPLPFGRGEVRLHYHVGGARCEEHPIQGGSTHEELLVLDLFDTMERQRANEKIKPMKKREQSFVDAFISALEG
jgi:hypothetical protein